MSDEFVAKGGADRVLFVLATLAKLERSVTPAELIAETGLSKSTLYRQLALLKRWGFVMESNGAYLPGPMCLPLAWGFDQLSYLVQEAHGELETLARNTGESVGLLATANNQVVCLDMVESPSSLRCSFVKGRGLPLWKGASAKTLLAFMDNDRRAAALRHLEHSGLVQQQDIVALKKTLEDIRAQGYCISDSEVDEGVWGIGAPIFQQYGHAIAAITLMAPNTRIHNRERQFIDMTSAIAARISSRLQSH
ncbi:IclR family transcriptional regulator [Pollutimonas harenae]|uniref:IclR family transcriptional regulator n=1 Tax=Pollutimonas harenae TaxID=657015 RepID=A0A853GZK9_9BURK|nr:IclR family transcriptional regulator [Pollutimonas harenae]NYT85200.1 IclR family transcriptional regulator [Pollutimonas harenae]TEA72426.1 IclR family transcriptional regulator [Pollutimonas harenae]